MSRIIQINFALSVWVTIVYFGSSFLGIAPDFPGSYAHLGSLKNHSLIWLAIVPSFSLLLWFAFYRHDRGKHAAFIMGLILITPFIGAFFSESVDDVRYDRVNLAVIGYLSLSHFLYSFLNISDLLRFLGQHD